MKKMSRKDYELPFVTEKLGWKYHHLGIPVSDPVPGEVYYPHLKIHVCGFSTSPFGIEWMRFDEDSPLPELVKTLPHVAFEVEDIDKELHEHGFEILCPPGMPSEGVRSAMIVHHGAPVELIEFKEQRAKSKEQRAKAHDS